MGPEILDHAGYRLTFIVTRQDDGNRRRASKFYVAFEIVDALRFKRFLGLSQLHRCKMPRFRRAGNSQNPKPRNESKQISGLKSKSQDRWWTTIDFASAEDHFNATCLRHESLYLFTTFSQAGETSKSCSSTLGESGRKLFPFPSLTEQKDWISIIFETHNLDRHLLCFLHINGIDIISFVCANIRGQLVNVFACDTPCKRFRSVS